MKIKIVRDSDIRPALYFGTTIYNLRIFDFVNSFYLEEKYDMVIYVNNNYIKILTSRFTKGKIIKRNKLKI